MHELPITENILEIVIKHANNAGAQKVNSINIVIGKLASVVDDSVQFYWDIIAKGTIAEEANLKFIRIPIKFLCQDCKNEFSPTDNEFSCSECKSINLKLLSGREFYIESIEIEN